MELGVAQVGLLVLFGWVVFVVVVEVEVSEVQGLFVGAQGLFVGAQELFVGVQGLFVAVVVVVLFVFEVVVEEDVLERDFLQESTSLSISRELTHHVFHTEDTCLQTMKIKVGEKKTGKRRTREINVSSIWAVRRKP